MAMLWRQGLANGVQGSGEPPEEMQQRNWAIRAHWVEDECYGFAWQDFGSRGV